jgi:hypothetical protein
MNIKLQTIKEFLLKIIISFALLLSATLAKDQGIDISAPVENDSTIIKEETGTRQLKYALMFNNSEKLNSLLFINPSVKIPNKPSGFLLEDGTTWFYESDLNHFKLAGMAGIVLSVETVGYYRLKELWYGWETGKLHSINFKAD